MSLGTQLGGTVGKVHELLFYNITTANFPERRVLSSLNPVSFTFCVCDLAISSFSEVTEIQLEWS